MALGRSKPLKALEGDLAAALKAHDEQALVVAAADAALNELDGTDPQAWGEAEAALLAAGSELARRARVLQSSYTACADCAEASARAEEAKIQAEQERLTKLAAEQEAALTQTRALLGHAEVALDEARRTTSESRVPYLDPTSPEAAAAGSRRGQRLELVDWWAKQRSPADWPKELRAEIEARRAQLEAWAREAREQRLAQARQDGTLVEHGGHGIRRL